MNYQDNSIVSAVLNQEENTIAITRRTPSNSMYACNPPKPVPDKITKEVYGVVDGKIVQIGTSKGEHVPGYFVPEKIN